MVTVANLWPVRQSGNGTKMCVVRGAVFSTVTVRSGGYEAALVIS
jgi:hypothetical protein